MTDVALATLDLRDEIDEELVCTAVVRETHDVLSFVLASPRGSAYRFQPGQHLTVTVGVAGTPMSRCYSISSSPARPDELTLTVKRVADGPVSGWLHDHLRVGGRLTVAGPLGAFSTDHFPTTRHLFLSAGSGVTPVMSMLRALCDEGRATDVVFMHHARTPSDLVFREDLEGLAARHPGVRVVFVCEGDDTDEDADPWTGRRGRLTLAALTEIAPDVADREVFLCGPAPYMTAARGFLTDAGADPARCHDESFDLLVADPPAVPVSVQDAGAAYTVELRRSGRSVVCEAGTSILLAASRAGVTLPSSCGEGVCGTCKTTLLSGSVEMNHAGGIRPREIAQDKILLCCSTPRGDIAIDV